jgi:hypothetical protein
LSQEIAIAMRSNRGPVAMTETRGELLHLPLGFPVNPMDPHGLCLDPSRSFQSELMWDTFDPDP